MKPSHYWSLVFIEKKNRNEHLLQGNEYIFICCVIQVSQWLIPINHYCMESLLRLTSLPLLCAIIFGCETSDLAVMGSRCPFFPRPRSQAIGAQSNILHHMVKRVDRPLSTSWKKSSAGGVLFQVFQQLLNSANWRFLSCWISTYATICIYLLWVYQ